MSSRVSTLTSYSGLRISCFWSRIFLMPLWPKLSLGGARSTTVKGLGWGACSWAHRLPFRLFSFKCACAPFYPQPQAWFFRADLLHPLEARPHVWWRMSLNPTLQERRPLKPAVVRAGFVPVPDYPLLLSWSFQDEGYIQASVAAALSQPSPLLPLTMGFWPHLLLSVPPLC